MINESVLAFLKDRLQDNQVDERLLNFVVNDSNVHSILYMSLENFCTAADIDEEQAFTFFKTFGANSLLAFKRILRESLYREISGSGVANRTVTSIANEVVRYELQNLTDFARTLDIPQTRRLAEDILSASEVVLFSHDCSSPSAQNLGRMLRVLGFNVYMSITESESDNAYLSALPETALVITFGLPRYSKAALLRLKLLKQQGVRIVSVTDSPESPFAFLSEYFFTVPLHSFDFTDSYGAVMAFISILSLTIASTNLDNTIVRLQKREENIDDTNMFF